MISTERKKKQETARLYTFNDLFSVHRCKMQLPSDMCDCNVLEINKHSVVGTDCVSTLCTTGASFVLSCHTGMWHGRAAVPIEWEPLKFNRWMTHTHTNNIKLVVVVRLIKAPISCVCGDKCDVNQSSVCALHIHTNCVFKIIIDWWLY